MQVYTDRRHMLMRRLDALAQAATRVYNRRNQHTVGDSPLLRYENSMRRYNALCRRWRRANRQLALLGAEAPQCLPKAYDEAVARRILRYFRHLEADAINEDKGHYWFHADIPRCDLLRPWDHCVGVHLAFLLECPGHAGLRKERYLHYRDGDRALVIACDRHRPWSPGREQAVHHLLSVCGAPNPPFEQTPWKTRPCAVFQRFFQILV